MTCEISDDGLRFIALRGIGKISPGDDLPGILAAAAERSGVVLSRGILVLCKKIVSKAEDRLVDLNDVEPSEQAKTIAKEDDKDPRHVEVVLQESRRIVRRGNGVLITETHHGFVCANAGVDLSNSLGDDIAVLLPLDSDASAAALHRALVARGSEQLGVVVTDTFGRPWREGLVDVAIGSAGMAPIIDHRGSLDLEGRELQSTTTALVDQIAAGAGILMVKDSGIPAVFVEGIIVSGSGKTRDLLRLPSQDLFR